MQLQRSLHINKSIHQSVTAHSSKETFSISRQIWSIYMLYFVCKIMLKLCVLNVKARLLYCKANLILSLSTCQRTRQNVFKYLLSNNLKIRKESPNSSLEEKAQNATTAPPPLRKGKRKEKKKKKKQQKRIVPFTPLDRPQSYVKYQ